MATVVRYQVKADRVAENEALIRAVYAELAEKDIRGLRYATYKLPDGVSFLHVALVEVEPNPLLGLESFKRFTANIKERCDVPPETLRTTVVGSHDGLG